MMTAAVAFVVATSTSLVATPLIRDWASRRGLLDHALSSRKIHGRPVPRLGGIAIVLGFHAAVAALYLLKDEVALLILSQQVKVAGFLVGGAAIAALGIFDDVRGSGARTKFLVQFGVAALMYGAGLRIDTLSLPFVEPIHLGFLALPFTMLWIAGVINALNLIDGLDGLAGGVALIALGACLAIGVPNGKPLTPLFVGALAGAVVGFLVYNFHPASIFMGDTGSMFLGFALATLAIPNSQGSTTAVALLVPVVALGVPIADTILAVARRAARGVPLFSADRGHIHHRLLALGLSQRQTVLVLYAVSALLGATAFVLSGATPGEALACLVALAVAGGLALRRLGFIDLGKAEQVFEARRRNLARLSVVHRVGETLRMAWTSEEVWGAVRSVARALGASAAALRLADETGDSEGFSSGFAEARSKLFVRGFRVGDERTRSGDVIELGWDDGRAEVDRDTEIAVELLCGHVSTTLARIRLHTLGTERPLAKVFGMR